MLLERAFRYSTIPGVLYLYFTQVPSPAKLLSLAQSISITEDLSESHFKYSPLQPLEISMLTVFSQMGCSSHKHYPFSH